MKKTRPIKNTWYDQLINYIPDPIRKSFSGFKDQIVTLFKTNTPKQAVHERTMNLSKPKTKSKIKKKKKKIWIDSIHVIRNNQKYLGTL